MVTMKDHDFWQQIRQALLMLVDVIERRLGIERTSNIRKLYRGRDKDVGKGHS